MVVSKFLLVSILDVLLGINFLSPVSLIYDALEESPSGYSDPRAQSTPYLLPDSMRLPRKAIPFRRMPLRQAQDRVKAIW